MAWPYVAALDNGAVANAGVTGAAVARATNGFVPPALAPGSNPVVEITSPADGSTITSSTTSFLATVSDGDGVDRVEMYVDDELIATETVAPYGFGGGDAVPPLDLTGYVNGSLVFKVIAYDELDNSTTVEHTVTLDYDDGSGDPGTPGTATYYISPSGNDSTGDGSSGSPWRTIAKAYSEASLGDVVEMAGGTYGAETIPFDAAKNPAFTLPTAAGQSDDRWGGSGPITFRAAAGATINTGNLTIDAGGIEFDGMDAAAFNVPYLYCSETTRFVFRGIALKQSLNMNSPQAAGFVDCTIGVGAAQDLDVFQMKANSSGVTPRNFYMMRTIVFSAYKPLGSSGHVDTMQIGGIDGLWFEDSYIRANTSPVGVQGFFIKEWTNPGVNIEVHNCWLEYTQMSTGVSGATFVGCRHELNWNIGSGGSESGCTAESGGTLAAAYTAGTRPWTD